VFRRKVGLAPTGIASTQVGRLAVRGQARFQLLAGDGAPQ